MLSYYCQIGKDFLKFSEKERNRKMETITKIAIILGIFAVTLAIGFGFNALLVWAVCKIMGWTFAWKWVILFTIIFAVLKSLFTVNAK